MSAAIHTPVAPDSLRTKALGRVRTAAVVAALACASNGAYAAFAEVIIDDFFLTATPDQANSFLFAPTDTLGQFWTIRTSANGAQTSINTGSVFDWAPISKTTTGTQASARVDSSQVTIGGLNAPAFHLQATANPLSNGVLYGANGRMFTEGSYCFYDADLDPRGLFDGTSTFCTGSGDVDFILSYSLGVTKGPGSPPTSAYAELDVTGFGVPNFGSFSNFSSTVAGIASKPGQQLSWTADLGLGDAATFDLTGIVVVQAVPEPGVLTLAALGLIGLAATRRRNVRAVVS